MTATIVTLILSTGSALIAVWAAVFAAREAGRATNEADRLRESRGRLIAMEHSVSELDARVRRAVGVASEARSRARHGARSIEVGDMLNGAPSDGEPDGELEALLSLQKATTTPGA